MQRLLIIAYLALIVTLGSATRSGSDDISPIFRRKPYKSTTESTETEETESTSSGEDGNKFRVGAEHYYDNRIDIQKQNDDLDIEEHEEEGTN